MKNLNSNYEYQLSKMKKLNNYEDLLDKYITLQTELSYFMELLGEELEEPTISTMESIKELYIKYNELFKCGYYRLDKKE